MKIRPITAALGRTLLLLLILVLSACHLPEIHLREYLRPVRKLFKKERAYWSDQMELRGETGTELIYYKNGRPALERYFDENGLLQTITYLGRNGNPVRWDSLVYADEELIAGYYYSEPGRNLILHFQSYKQQGQLSQRSWFGSVGELLSREFFLFDRNGQRRTRMIFDGNDSLLFSETFSRDSDQLEIQNTYSIAGNLTSQTRYLPDQLAFRYDFDPSGLVTRISRLQHDGIPAWSSDLFYDQLGALERSNFYTNGRFLYTYMGDLELYQQTLRSWKHPALPTRVEHLFKIGHQDPFIVETAHAKHGLQTLEYRLPESGALFKRSIRNEMAVPVSDTLYANRGACRPVSVVAYDKGLVSYEITYDLDGQPKWRHTWFRDDHDRVIREEVIGLPNTFESAVTRIYDSFSLPALSERFSTPDSFDGSWAFYQGGGINKTLFYNNNSELTESWSLRPAGDTIQHSTFQTLEYLRIESKLGKLDTLLSQRRFTEDGMLNWELFFDRTGQLIQEVHRKNDGSIYRDVTYNPENRVIKTSTFAPVNINELGGEELRGEVASQVITRLNAAGKTVQVISRNSSGVTAWEKRYAYRGGRLVKSVQFGSDGKPAIISTYQHNEQGQIISEIALDQAGGQVHTVEYRYNEKQELIWKMFSSLRANTISSNRYYYDDMGRLQRDEIIEDKHFIEAVEYEYFPEYYLRIAVHSDPKGGLLRKEIENYFGESVFLSISGKNE